MSIAERLKIDDKGIFASLLFFAVSGVIFLGLLPSSDYAPHIGILGIFSLISAYGLLEKRSWSIYLVLIVFFSGTIFAAYMLYYGLVSDLITGLLALAYVVLTWIFTILVAAKRKALET